MLALSDYVKNLFDIPHGLFYIILGVTIIMSTVSFILFYMDSKKAISSTSKFSNTTLSVYTILLGSLGTILAILLLNYKNRRTFYLIEATLCLIINITFMVLIF